MDWKELGHKVADFAPILGSALVPGGGAIGSLISAAFGTKNDPSEIMAAIERDPQAAVKLKEIESTEAIELKRIAMQSVTLQLAEKTKQVLAVNATMQEEAKSDNWWTSGWRPFWGFISGGAFFVISCAICYLAYKAVIGKQPEALTMIPQLISSLAMLFSIPMAILGVTAWHRGQLQRTRAGEVRQPGLIGAITQRIAGGKQ